MTDSPLHGRHGPGRAREEQQEASESAAAEARRRYSLKPQAVTPSQADRSSMYRATAAGPGSDDAGPGGVRVTESESPSPSP